LKWHWGVTASAQLSRQLGYYLNHKILLNWLTKQSLPPIPLVKTLGVDDFAFLRGQLYSTILVDIDRHRPVAPLQNREAATLVKWLQQHPEAQGITFIWGDVRRQ